MVTCNVDAVPKMSRPRRGSSVSSGFRLVDGDQCDNASSISRNSIYKQKIDLMFDDSRSIVSHLRLDEQCSTRERPRASSMHGSARESSSSTRASRSAISIVDGGVQSTRTKHGRDSHHISNSVQAQIERMFTDVAKDATSCSFAVRCLGTLPLKEKVTSLQGLQEPLRQLYLSGAGHGNQNAGTLDICSSGLRVRLTNGRDAQLTPFHNIAVWSAVKFVVSASEGGAAFLPLITDPENIDKSTLFRPLSASDKRRLSSGLHAPIFAVVMRSTNAPKQLECYGFVCQTPEDAIVIAATLYQSLMAHVGTSQKQRRPRNRNGVSCISIASSSTQNPLATKKMSTHGMGGLGVGVPLPPPARPPRKKRTATSSLSGESDTKQEAIIESSTEERKKKSSKSKRAPPIPSTNPPLKGKMTDMYNYLDEQRRARNNSNAIMNHNLESPYQLCDASGGDIFTRVAIPRSGSFLNTGGLTRYKSRATRRHAGKTGGGGGSPLGFSELFNEFRLQENLHSLDEILNAIIDSDGMSFNDLKPIYKEFLLKLAVTLTKDELYQRSKNIMRRQKKKKLRRKASSSPVESQRVKNKKPIIGTKGLKNVFRFGKFRNNKANAKASTGKAVEKAKGRQFEKSESVDRNKDMQRSARGMATSGSEVSDARNEHTLNAQNRNSSSGYVSCSECSYDSEACTCDSADRCYCSLGADNEVNAKLAKAGARDSILSCRTEDKCYCSMDEMPKAKVDNDANSVGTCSDSDSCASVSKCYCRHGVPNKAHVYSSDNLALDYELFTVGGSIDGGGGRQVKAHEALSVKKSVEMAAVFADVKLSQTTDIKSLVSTTNGTSGDKFKKAPSVSSSRKTGSHSSNDLVMLRREVDKPTKRNAKSDGYYQPINPRPVSASLEDSLGYLP